MAKNEAKIRFTAETGEFNQDIKESSQKIVEMKAALKLNKEQMQTNGKSVAALTNKHDLLENQLEASKSKTDALSAKVEKAIHIYGENSSEASKLKTQLLNAQSAEEKIKQSINQCNSELQEQSEGLKKTGSSAENSTGGFSVLKGALADLSSKAIQACIGKLSEFVGWLKGLPEATMEARQDMATLDTSFQTMGFTTQQGTETFKQLYAVFGEDDRAIETANNISHLAKNQEDLNNWVNITTGIWGSYQDALPVEGLAEASNETAKVGKVTGVLADALNWSSEAATMFAGYMGGDVVTAEDAFNVALSECSTEQERQQLITSTLNSLYGEAANKYRDTAGAQMEAKNAIVEQQLAEQNLAIAVEPVTTKFTELKTQLITGLTPAITALSTKATEALTWMQAHPAAMQAIAVVLGVLSAALVAFTIATTAQTVAQWAMNSAILANPVTWIVVGVVAAIAALIAAGVALYQNWDTIKAKAVEIKNNVVAKFNELKDKVTTTFNNIKTKITTPIEEAKAKIHEMVDRIKGFFTGMHLELPKIKLPHFHLTGELSLSPPSVPKLKIDWYANGGIMTKPTLFGFNGNRAMVGGEAGPEAILPIDRLNEFIQNDIDNRPEIINFDTLANAIDNLANRPTELYIDGKRFAQATANANDQVNGMRQIIKNRGGAL